MRTLGGRFGRNLDLRKFWGANSSAIQIEPPRSAAVAIQIKVSAAVAITPPTKMAFIILRAPSGRTVVIAKI